MTPAQPEDPFVFVPGGSPPRDLIDVAAVLKLLEAPLDKPVCRVADVAQRAITRRQMAHIRSTVEALCAEGQRWWDVVEGPPGTSNEVVRAAVRPVLICVR